MELEERKLYNCYTVIHGNTDTPWYTRYRRILWVFLAVSSIALIIAIISISVKCLTCDEGSSSTEYLIDSEQLKWDGVCPHTHSECPSSFQNIPPLLIVSLDGFRVDYLNRGVSPTLSRIAECGVKADFMYPIYPSKTFPNHYSIVTGLYPSSHGIIDNSMYDNDLKKLFKVGNTPLDDPKWWKKEPIWVTAQKQGKSAATYFWPGSDVRINGSFPDIYRPYNKSTPFETQVDQVLEWLSSPNHQDFLTLYFDEPDSAAHVHGPHSQEVNNAVRRVDSMLNRLLAGLQMRNLTNCVNIIIVSDHGMADLECDRVVDIRRYTDISKIFSFLSSFGRLKPKDNLTSVDVEIPKFRCQNSHLRAYRKEELPIRMHYAENARIEPIILDVDAGYYLVNRDIQPDDWKCTGGNHGYDNLYPAMRAIFLAQGPSFKQNISVPSFLNLELYELMCEVIGINPEPNNGTRGSLHQILRNPADLLPQKPIPSPPVAEAPANKQEFQSRIDASNCSCLQVPEQEIDAPVVENRTRFHLPFGIPHTTDDSLVLLYNKDYILAYDMRSHYPRWTGFTITGTKNSSEMIICWSGDARVVNATCVPAPEGLIQRPLYPPEFSDLPVQREAFYVTNSIPKSVNHTTLLEKEMNDIIEKRASKVGPLNVMMGPAFDPLSSENLDSSRSNDSVLVPTHIFVVLTWCTARVNTLNECDPALLDVHSFILPNFPYPDNCQVAGDVIKKNVARVVDIEKMTGITFYTEMTTYEAVRLRTSMSHLTL